MASFRKRQGRWQVQIRRQGHAPVSQTFSTRSEAREWAVKQEGALIPLAQGASQTSLRRILLADVMQRYAAEVSPRKKGSDIERIRLTSLERDAVARVPVARLSPADIAGYRDRRMALVAPDTVRRELALLNSVIQTARIDWGIPLGSNPVSLVKKPAPSPARERRIHRDELKRLQAALQKARNADFREVVGFALATAMRRSELLALTWPDIDLENGIARLSEGKNGHGRSVPLSREARTILKMSNRFQP